MELQIKLLLEKNSNSFNFSVYTTRPNRVKKIALFICLKKILIQELLDLGSFSILNQVNFKLNCSLLLKEVLI